MTPRAHRRLRAAAAITGLAALAALVAQCAVEPDVPETVVARAPSGLPPVPRVPATRSVFAAAAGVPSPTSRPETAAATVRKAPSRKPAAKKTVSRKKKPTKKRASRTSARANRKKLRADVVPRDFEVSGVSVSESGYRAHIEGWVRLTRKGAMAQPLLSFDLKDGDGNVIRSGSFTPVDATGPVWLGYDALGLKRVPFTATVDLRSADGGVLPAVPPRPYSASVRVAEVIDAKPAAR